MEPLLLTIPDASVLLGVSDKTLWLWVYQGKIGSVKLGRSRRIKRIDIERFITAGYIPERQQDRETV
jgi:excisionase family DNA binding protein